jgi:RNA-binding protein
MIDIKSLKAQAHHLKPIILIGHKGVTDSLLQEANIALTTHELIKIKSPSLPKVEKVALFQQICEALSAILVQHIGNIATIYRKNNDK